MISAQVIQVMSVSLTLMTVHPLPATTRVTVHTQSMATHVPALKVRGALIILVYVLLISRYHKY